MRGLALGRGVLLSQAMRMTISGMLAMVAVSVVLTACVTSSQPRGSAAPVADRHPVIRELSGDRFVDDYFWLRQKTNPAVIQYLEAENAYTAARTRHTEALREKLYREMVGRIQETDLSVPFRKNGWFYYSRTEQGQQYPTHCRKPVSGSGAEEVLLDVNELAKGQKFMSVGSMDVSDDTRLLAYSTDNTGFRQYRLQVKELGTGRILEAAAERVTSVAWAADNRTLFYTTEDPVTKRSDRLFRRELDGSAELVLEEKDERFSLGVGRTRSGDYLILRDASRTTTEMQVLDARQPRGAWRMIAPREQDHEYGLDHHGDQFFIWSNKPGRNYALFTVPVADPGPAGWKEILPHRADTMLESVLCFANHYVVHERVGGLVRFTVVRFDGRPSHAMQFPEAAYSANPGANEEYVTDKFRYDYSSPSTPPSVFDHDLNVGTSALLKREPVLGGYDPAQYRVERREATARDGTKIPVSILSRHDAPRDGSSPLLLRGYGAYGIPSDASFSSSVFSLVDRGMTVATAHIRGGGDLGKTWHDGGRMANKMNSFTDFIDCAEFLVAERYTDKPRLIITGGSAGGLLMGAVTNLRPDLFKAVVSYVPFVDVINTMLDEDLPLTVEEFEEWGNPKVPDQYRWLRKYCPYTNLEPKAYPALLVKTSLNDSQVMYWEPAKYVARMRALKKDDHPLLFHCNMDAGHGGASGRYDYLKERAFDYAFMLDQVGLRD
jgi:oligopeptidase B